MQLLLIINSSHSSSPSPAGTTVCDSPDVLVFSFLLLKSVFLHGDADVQAQPRSHIGLWVPLVTVVVNLETGYESQKWAGQAGAISVLWLCKDLCFPLESAWACTSDRHITFQMWGIIIPLNLDYWSGVDVCRKCGQPYNMLLEFFVPLQKTQTNRKMFSCHSRYSTRKITYQHEIHFFPITPTVDETHY